MKTAGIAIAVLYMMFIIGSVTFIACEMHHECEGESCPICEELQTLEGMLFRSTAMILPAVIAIMSYRLTKDIFNGYICTVIYDSPINLKVRLLN